MKNANEVLDELHSESRKGLVVTNSTVPLNVMIETPGGDLLEIDKIYISLAAGGQIVIKALAYDDEFDEAEAAEEAVETANVEATFAAGLGTVTAVANLPAGF